MKDVESKLRSYVEKCFKDAFEAEGRLYHEKFWNFEYVMAKNSSGVYQLYPIMYCRFDRVLRRVKFRLENNLMKNFGIQYEDTDEMYGGLYVFGQIDLNFTQAMFKYKGCNISLSIYDKNTNSYENVNLQGECIVAGTYEKLLFKYWGLDADSYMKLPENDEKKSLPDSIRCNWDNFKELYSKTFNKPLGDGYSIICSSGLTRI